VSELNTAVQCECQY